jgi:hypothetical protein
VSVILLSTIRLSVSLLRFVIIVVIYAERHFAECHSAECLCVGYSYALCCYTDWSYAECDYAKCRSSQRRGAVPIIKDIKVLDYSSKILGLASNTVFGYTIETFHSC